MLIHCCLHVFLVQMLSHSIVWTKIFCFVQAFRNIALRHSWRKNTNLISSPWRACFYKGCASIFDSTIAGLCVFCRGIFYKLT